MSAEKVEKQPIGVRRIFVNPKHVVAYTFDHISDTSLHPEGKIQLKITFYLDLPDRRFVGWTETFDSFILCNQRMEEIVRFLGEQCATKWFPRSFCLYSNDEPSVVKSGG